MDLTAVAQLAQAPQEAAVDKNDKQAVAKQFEKVFTRLLVAELQKTMKNSDLFSGPTMDAFDGVFQEAMVDNLTEGRGLGLANHLLRQLDGPTSLPPRRATPAVPPGGLPTNGRITSGYGQRADPFTGERRQHSGVDIAAAKGAPIRAAREGKVVFSGPRGGYGNVVIVDHGDGLQTRYAHCDALEVSEGEQVQAGQVIGTVGQTGRATGDHLHFEARQNGTAIDPMKILKKKP